MERNFLFKDLEQFGFVNYLDRELEILNPFGEIGGGRITNKKDPDAADVTTITWNGRDYPIHKAAKFAWEKMVSDARNAGFKYPLLMPTSGYRSSKRQAELWQQALKKHGSPEEARKWVAPPGSSAHQSGRTFDLHLGLRNNSENVKNGKLRATPIYQWLSKNAVNYGFYPYDREPWHWEYNPPAGFSLGTIPVNVGLVMPSSANRGSNSSDAVTYNLRNYSNWQTDEYAIYQVLGFTNSTPSAESLVDAVKSWQRANGLTSDGKLGTNTLKKLRDVIKNGSSSSSNYSSGQMSSSSTNSNNLSSFSNDLNKAIDYNRQHYAEWSNIESEIHKILGFSSSPDSVDFTKAIIQWQKMRGLTSDGKLGGMTQKRFRNMIRSKKLFDSMKINDAKWYKEAEKIVDNIFIPNKARYETIAKRFQQQAIPNAQIMPWWFIACIHSHESGSNFSKHLHNGDSLLDYTKNIPRGRPQIGHGPPFTFEESAVDALLGHFREIIEWNFYDIFYLFEKYNGMGYFKKGINTPYIWSGTNHYTKGKFVKDGIFDPNFVSKQVGIGVKLKILIERGLIK